MSIPRMRTLPQALAEIKKLDPNSAITLRALRRMTSTGELPFIPVESKRLINLDNLLEYFSNPPEQIHKETTTGGIRRIDESVKGYG